MAGRRRSAKRRRGPRSQPDTTGTKRRASDPPNQQAPNVGDDDDFVSPPRVFLQLLQAEPAWDAPVYELMEEEKDRFPSMTTRVTGKALVDAITNLNARQRATVTAIGFQEILNLRVIKTPKRLGRWLLMNFDPSTMTITLENQKILQIGEDEVHRVLGLPRGETEVRNRDPNDVTRTLLEWRGSFLTTKHKITPLMVCNMLGEFPDGCEIFKRHFTVLVVTTLIRAMQNGYCHQLFVDDLDDVNQIPNLNWCKYLLTNLVETHDKWKTGQHKRFCGPLLFLTVLYMDRVNFHGNVIPRQVPRIKGWTYRIMRDREFAEIRLGGFGMGLLLPPEMDNTNAVPMCEEEKGFEERVAEKMTMLKTIVLELEDLIEETGDSTEKEKIVREIQQATEKVMGMMGTHRRNETIATGSKETSDTQHDEDFWANPENIRVVEAVERAAQVRAERSEMPSFSLGFTQAGVNEGWAAIDNIAREYTAGEAKDDTTREEAGSMEVTPNDIEIEAEDACATGVDTIAPPSADIVNTPAEQIIGIHDSGKKNMCGPPFGAPTNMGRPDTIEKELEDGEMAMLSHYISQIMRIPYEEIPQPFVVLQWIAQSVNNDMYEVLFSYRNRVARLLDFTSLLMEQEVSVGIINAWACILNCREHQNTNGGPKRVFASATTTLQTVVDYKKSRKQRLEWFSSRLISDLETSPYKKWSNVDMVNFPILQSGHFYIISFDLVKMKIEIIDNSSTKMPNDRKYLSIPEDLIDLLSTHLYDEGEVVRSGDMTRVTPTRMQMPWRDTKNKTDCGVYAMRHMETFVGQSFSSWKCGLVKGDLAYLRNLRMIYMREILMANINEHQASNIKRAREFQHRLFRGYVQDTA